MARLLPVVLALLSTLQTSAAMDAQLIRTTWGVPAFEEPENWQGWMLEAAGGPIAYAGLEAPTWSICLGAPVYDGCTHGCNATRARLFRDALAASGLLYVAQIHVCGVPIQSAAVDDALASLRAQAEVAKELGAALLNVHDGVDIWSDDETLAYFKGALAIEREVGIDMAHETHRTRALATPRMTLKVLAAFPEVKLTADLSHWVIAAERAFDFPSDAAWWPPALAAVANATVLTHSRVGSAEAIQVNDPSAPEHQDLIAIYESWWNVIWTTQHSKGLPVLVEPEFGPAPYLPTAPHTNWPLADLAKAVEYMSTRQLRRIESGQCKVR